MYGSAGGVMMEQSQQSSQVALSNAGYIFVCKTRQKESILRCWKKYFHFVYLFLKMVKYFTYSSGNLLVQRILVLIKNIDFQPVKYNYAGVVVYYKK